jgi:hypothetical protein
MGFDDMTIEEMKAELEAAGYKDISDSSRIGAWGLAHPVYGFDVVFPNIYVAHEHLQKERQFETMKSLLEYLRQRGIDANANSKFDDRLRWWAGGVVDTINEKMGWAGE